MYGSTASLQKLCGLYWLEKQTDFCVSLVSFQTSKAYKASTTVSLAENANGKDVTSKHDLLINESIGRPYFSWRTEIRLRMMFPAFKVLELSLLLYEVESNSLMSEQSEENPNKKQQPTTTSTISSLILFSGALQQ